MKKVNLRDIEEETWASPKGNFEGFCQGLSLALGREENSTDLLKRHPFDVEIMRVPPGKRPFPYHSHSAQWELYYVTAGTGSVRHEHGVTSVATGDTFIFPPGKPHEFINDSEEDLVVIIVADNPIGESCHYPDSGKWVVRSPERRIIRSDPMTYYDGEE